jgi:hypothetical protein
MIFPSKIGKLSLGSTYVFPLRSAISTPEASSKRMVYATFLATESKFGFSTMATA